MTGPRLSVVGSRRRQGDRPVIVLMPGQLPEKVDEAEAVILGDYAHWGLFQRAGSLVRVARADVSEKVQSVIRSPEAIVLRQATVPMLQDIFGRAIWFEALCMPPGPPTRAIDCPAKVANIYLSRAGLWRLPTLTGIINTPVMRPNGSILTDDGFDATTGLLLYSAIEWPALLPSPTQAEAVKAAKVLLESFAEFPLKDADRAVIVSAILTGLQRRLLESAPAHAFDAPSQGSGKSLLADCVSIIVTGIRGASMSANADEEELRKKLVSVLIAGDAIVSLDNVTKPLRSEALATILTLSTYADRILGASQKVAVPTNALFLITGNNLAFSGDMPSRVIVARLEPNVERPEERCFKISDLRAHVLEHRPGLVRAALTILTGYFAAGRPAQGVKPFGRFEQWSREIREAIIWAGMEDPVKTRESVIAADPERDATLAVFAEWVRAADGRPITLSELIVIAASDETLKGVLIEVAADDKQPSQVNPRRLGAWCRYHVGRVVGDFKLVKEGDARGGFTRWKVVRVGTKPQSETAIEEIITREV
jgi:putative DNA primase/helicase